MKYTNENDKNYLVFDTGKKIELSESENQEYQNKIKEYILIGKLKERQQ